MPFTVDIDTISVMINQKNWSNVVINKTHLLHRITSLLFRNRQKRKLVWIRKLKAQLYVQLLYKPHLRTLILQFGLFGQISAVRANLWNDRKYPTFWGACFMFSWTNCLVSKNIVASAQKWYFVTKIVLTYCEKISSDREKLLKFEAEGQEFAKFWDH